MLSWRSLTRAKGLLIEQAEKLGEPPEDPLLLFSVLYGAWVASVFASSCDVHCELAAHFLALAEQQGSITAVMIGHRLMGTSLVLTGTLVEGRAHLDRALALYDPVQHQPLAMRFGQDVAVVNLMSRCQVLWLLGYPDAALADAERALKTAREIGHATTLLYALSYIPSAYVESGNYATAKALADEGGKLATKRVRCSGGRWGR